MKNVFMEEMSWQEIQDAREQGADTVLICAASQEQHGPHMAENTDYVLGRAAYGRAAERLGNILVAPVIRPGLSGHHMAFPGSLTLRPEIFRGIVEDYVEAYVRQGFRKIILGSSHGGNFAVMEELAAELGRGYPGTEIFSALSLSDFMELCGESERRFCLPEGSCGGHACCFETSIMLYLRPELVHMDRAVCGYMGTDREGAAAALLKSGMKGLSEDGILGDPTVSTAEMGKVFLDLFVEKICRGIREKSGCGR